MTSDAAQVQRPGPVALSLLVFGGTGAWTLRFTLGYLLVPVACEVGALPLHLVTLGTAALAVAALVWSLRWMRRLDDVAVTFALGFGAALDAFFLGAILLEGSSVLFVDACLKGAIP